MEGDDTHIERSRDFNMGPQWNFLKVLRNRDSFVVYLWWDTLFLISYHFSSARKAVLSKEKSVFVKTEAQAQLPELFVQP